MIVDRAVIVIALAPERPPCFATRASWHTYLVSAATEHHDERPQSPLVVSNFRPPSFNYNFSPCCDCTEARSHEMYVEGRCVPEHLLLLAPKRAPQPNPLADYTPDPADFGVGLDEEIADGELTDFGALT